MRLRKQTGGSIAEMAGAMSVLLPIIIAIIVCAWEASYAYSIHTAIDSGARRAARDLAAAYAGSEPNAATIAGIYSNIRIPNMINHNDQFSHTFNAGDNPPSVTVSCTYKNEAGWGLPRFPNPDPLNLGQNFEVKSVATYRLEM